MCKSSDCKPKKAAIKLNNLIQNLGLESSSFGKYNRIIDLHGLSVQNRIIENQLLQNWISFETLLVGYSKLSKIDQVINHILPFLLDSYVKSKLYTLAKSINKYDPRFFYNEIRMISDGDNLIQKFAALIVLEKYKENRRRFYDHLRYQPLAKFRLADFNKTFNNVELLTKHIDTHKTRVVWQIKRMYRTRNLIVHAGVVPNFTDALVENSHTYLDKVVNLINHMRINEHSIQSIEQAIKEVEIKENIYRKNLKQCKEINENNFSSILL